MNIRQLEAFRAMMQAGTTKGAAELIGMSQPAVSRLIEAFEHAVDLPLFSRVRNRLTPTPEAVLLFEAVERTFASARSRPTSGLPTPASIPWPPYPLSP